MINPSRLPLAHWTVVLSVLLATSGPKGIPSVPSLGLEIPLLLLTPAIAVVLQRELIDRLGRPTSTHILSTTPTSPPEYSAYTLPYIVPIRVTTVPIAASVPTSAPPQRATPAPATGVPSMVQLGGTWVPTSTKKRAVATAALATPPPPPPRITSTQELGGWAPTSTKKKGAPALPTAGVVRERRGWVSAAPLSSVAIWA